MVVNEAYINRHENYSQLCAVMCGHAGGVHHSNLVESKDIMDIFLSHVKPLDLSVQVYDFLEIYKKAITEWKQSYQD